MLRNSKVLNEVHIPIHEWCGFEYGITGNDNTFLEVRRHVDNDPNNLIAKDIYIINKLWLHVAVDGINKLSIAISIDIKFNKSVINGNPINKNYGLCVLLKLSDLLNYNGLYYTSKLNPYNISLKNIGSIDNNYRLYSSTNMNVTIYNNYMHDYVNNVILPMYLSDNGIKGDIFNDLRLMWRTSSWNLLQYGVEDNESYVDSINIQSNTSLHYMNNIFAMDNYEALKKKLSI